MSLTESLSATNSEVSTGTISLVLMHLIPGFAFTLMVLLLGNLLDTTRVPLIMATSISHLLVTIPVMGGYLLYLKRVKKVSITPYTEKLGSARFIGYLVALLVISFAIAGLLGTVGQSLKEQVFYWMPEVFRSETIENPVIYSSNILIVTFILALITTGIGVPIIEELYFRGHLMSQFSSGKVVPAINVMLWSLAHFWVPWNFFFYTFVFIPVAYVVYYKKNIYLSISAHMIANLMLVMSFLPLIA